MTVDIALVCDYSIPSVACDACVFADVLAEAGFRPYIISSGKVYRGVSRYWDSKVSRLSFYRKLRKVREVVFVNHDDYPEGDTSTASLAMELATVLDVPLAFAGWDIESGGRYTGSGDSQLVSYLQSHYPNVLSDWPESYEDLWSIRLEGMREHLRLFGIDRRSVTFGLSVESSRQFSVDYSHCNTDHPQIAVLSVASSSQSSCDRLRMAATVARLLEEGADFTILSRKLGHFPSAIRHAISAGQCKHRSFEYFDDIPLMLQGFCGCVVVSSRASRGCLVSVVSRVPIICDGVQGLLPGKIVKHFVDKITVGS